MFFINFWGRSSVRKPLFTRTAGLVAIALSAGLGSCGFFGGEQASEEPVSEEAQTVPAQPAAEEEAAAAESETTAAPSAAAIANADLIQSTNPSERVQQIERSRANPYETVPIPPPPPATPPQPTAPGTQANGGTSPGGGQPAPGGNGAQAENGEQAEDPSPTPIQPGEEGIATLPQLPNTDLASAVRVTGVVRIGNQNFAIIEAPEERTSRYVQVGQRIANNRVLVKRIELTGNAQPTVILEENGVEVARPVGDTGGPVEEEPTAARDVPSQVVANLSPKPQG